MEKVDVLDQDDKKGTRKLSGSGSVLATGIISIIFVSIIGVLLAISTIIKANPQISEYERHPSLYDEKYYKRLKAGKYCAIAGLLLKLLALVILMAIFG